jgi:HEAT repeat protein
MTMPKPDPADSVATQDWLRRLSPPKVEKSVQLVESLLSSRFVLVRMEAAQALGRAGVGLDAILARVGQEKNELVMTDLTEALLSTGDPMCIPLLKNLAEHLSALVRSYALMALADLVQGDSLPFLRARLECESHRRVKATLRGLLFVYGDEEGFGGIRACLRSRDATIRAATANLLRHYRPRRKRREVLAALAAAAQNEKYPGIRGDLEKTIRILEGRRKEQSRLARAG